MMITSGYENRKARVEMLPLIDVVYLYLHKTNTLTLGVETEKEKGESDYYSESAWGPYTSTFEKKTARTTGYYLQDQVKLWDSWFTTLGIRLDDHSRFGSETTYRIASAYLIRQTGTKFKGTYGTGFKAPSLYQLYSQYGDQNLDPEESTGWDIGVEQSLFDKKLILGATYFSNEFDELIEFESDTSKYINVAEAEAKGVEVFASVYLARHTGGVGRLRTGQSGRIVRYNKKYSGIWKGGEPLGRRL